MGKKITKTIYYNPHIKFPCLSWKLTFKEPIPRKEIPNLCEQLHAIVHERIGACIYYPDTENGYLVCRYEWMRNYKKEKHALHLGLIITIGSDDIKELSIYVSTNRAMEDNSLNLPEFPKGLLTRLQKEIVSLLNEASYRLEKESQKEINVVFYIESHFCPVKPKPGLTGY